MKIICVDSYNRDGYDDMLICENINKCYGKYIVDKLNKKFGGEDPPYYFRLVEDDHKLRIFEGY